MSLKIKKTIKLFINGEFPRTESGRSFAVHIHNQDQIYAELCQASRKDLRGAVEAAKAAEKDWSQRTAYNRAQILYRMAEMIEGKRSEFKQLFKDTLGWSESQADESVDQALDSVIYFAGFADKFSQVAATLNPVQGSLHNFSFPEPVGVVAAIVPDHFDFAQLMGRMSAIISSGNTCVMLLGMGCPTVIGLLGEVMATSDVPKGVINLLTGFVDELYEPMASHMEIRSLCYEHGSPEFLAHIQKVAVDNLKRVVIPHGEQIKHLRAITDFVEYKTTWHPVGF